MSIFEIEAADVASLADGDLRQLVAKLCVADLALSGQAATHVTFGGDQDAKDGGIDVRVECTSGTAEPIGSVPRRTTGFQVKKPDMPAGEIRKEMRPGGVLRESIASLAKVGGAYVIVSSTGSVSDSALKARRDAMREALSGLAEASGLKTDFFDRTRLATWSNQHPGLVLWVRERLGQPLAGWRPYQSWSSPSEDTAAEYLIDDAARLHDGPAVDAQGGLTIPDGLTRIRNHLSVGGRSVRLVGLSGMGKTRLVQALFDGRIGEHPLSEEQAIYTDLADDPDPHPRDLARRLVQSKQRAVLIIDNCPAELHRALRAIVAQVESQVSLLTVEYDIRDDEPESTEVFRLEPSSAKVLSTLIERRVPTISEADARRIAEFSGGNARMALAIANTIQRGESVARLSDDDLFKRLFHQRHAHDDALLRAAEAAALVYSFDGEELGDAGELTILARLAGCSVPDLYRHIGELRERDLVQKRSKWRAVLPQAMANRLASRALKRISPTALQENLVEKAEDRLFRSFTRRLGLIHDSPEAVDIVKAWFTPGGLLADITSLSGLGLAAFLNVAPVSPALALDAVERAFGLGLLDAARQAGGRFERDKFTRLLRDIAYDPALFGKAATLLAQICAVEPEGSGGDATRRRFEALFQVRYSGTLAPPESRLVVIENLLSSNDAAQRDWGLIALGALLNPGHVGGDIGTDFGARSRSYGWHPKSADELRSWFTTALPKLVDVAVSDTPQASKAKSILAGQFKSLWRLGIADDLTSAMMRVRSMGFWPDGWIAIKNTLRRDEDRMPREVEAKLRNLETGLRPDGLEETIKAYAFSKTWTALDIAEAEPGSSEQTMEKFERVNRLVVELGKNLADDRSSFDSLLPTLVSQEGGRVFQLGSGLGVGVKEPTGLWADLVEAFGSVPASDRKVEILRAYLAGAWTEHPEFVSAALDAAVGDAVLAAWYPLLQSAIPLDPLGTDRLLLSIDVNAAKAWTYNWLAYGRASEALPNQSLSTILRKIAEKPDGLLVAMDVLYMRFHGAEESDKHPESELSKCGRALLLMSPFDRGSDRLDHITAELVEICFAGPDHGEEVKDLIERMIVGEGYYWEFDQTLAAICGVQPSAALDALLDRADPAIGISILSGPGARNYPLDKADLQAILGWAGDDGARFEKLATVVSLFESASGETTDPDEARTVRLTTVAQQIIERSPNKEGVLIAMTERLIPGGWSGSLATILDHRANALRVLTNHQDQTIAEWSRMQIASLKKRADLWREREKGEDQSFE